VKLGLELVRAMLEEHTTTTIRQWNAAADEGQVIQIDATESNYRLDYLAWCTWMIEWFTQNEPHSASVSNSTAAALDFKCTSEITK